MIVTIIAGGAGTRLWPLSSPEKPKHLIKLIGDRTLIEGAFERAQAVTSNDKIFLITVQSQVEDARRLLPDLPAENLIVEPAVRGTGNCKLAVMHFLKKRGADPDEPILFVPADHLVRDVKGYANSFKITEAAARKHNKIVLTGVEPDYPNTGLGWIHKGPLLEEGGIIYQLDKFKEKPDLPLAKKYVKSGEYLFNCNYYCGSINAFEAAIKQYSPVMQKHIDILNSTKDDASFTEAYLALDEVITDYALSELVPPGTMLLMPGTFDWVDVGLYGDLYDFVEKDDNGNFALGDKVVAVDVENSYLRNEDVAEPMIVIGLDNVVVVRTPLGLLVTRKDLANKVKEALKELKGDNS